MYRIGKIIKTHGIKGEVKVAKIGDFERLIPGKVIYFYDNKTKVNLTIETVRMQQQIYLVKFKEYNSLTEVEKIKGIHLFTDEDPNLLEDEFTHQMLIGMDVITIDNINVGKVVDVLSLPSQDILVIKGEKPKEILVPFLKEFIVKVEDKIIIKVIEGMLW